jgi:hypothetical protein
MQRVYFTEHKGRRIVVLDLSELSAEATPPVLQELEKTVAQQPAEKNV